MFIGIIAGLILPRRASNQYLCLAHTDSFSLTHTLDTETGQLITTHPLGKDAQDFTTIQAYYSEDRHRIIFQPVSSIQNFVKVLNVLTRHRYTVWLGKYGFSVIGWSASGKYFAITEQTLFMYESVLIFDGETGQRVFSHQWKRLYGEYAQWSPAGDQLAYLETPDGMTPKLTVIFPEAQMYQTKLLPDFQRTGQYDTIAEVVWSPDAKHIAVHNSKTRVGIYSVDQQSIQKITDLVDPQLTWIDAGMLVEWSADGRSLVYLSTISDGKNNLKTFDISAGISSIIMPDVMALLYPLVFDGQYLVVKQINIDSTFVYSILDTTTFAHHRINNISSDPIWLGPISDSQFLFFQSERGFTLTKPDGSTQYVIQGVEHSNILNWNRDRVAYTGTKPGLTLVGTIDLKTGERREFEESTNENEQQTIHLSPNGRTVTWIIWRKDRLGGWRVKFASTDGSWVKTFKFSASTGDDYRAYGWSPDSTRFAFGKYDMSDALSTVYLWNTDSASLQEFDGFAEVVYFDRWTNCQTE